MRNELLTTSEVAAMLGVSIPTVCRWAKTEPPKLAPVKRGEGLRGAMVFLKSDVETFAEQQATRA